NDGDVPLNNVVIHDVNNKHGASNIACGDLAVGAVCTKTRTITTVLADCPEVSDTATTTGTDACTGQPLTSALSATCIIPVGCQPCLTISKEVACFLGTNSQGIEVCGDFSHSATGFKVVTGMTTNLPAFCYSITVSNCGAVDLTNVRVIDDQFDNL